MDLPFKTVPIRDKVYEYLKVAILNGEFPVGQMINEMELAAKLNISRTPIQQAMYRLESLGLVKNHPRKGASVTKSVQESVLDIFSILIQLEGLVVKLAVQRLDYESRGKLQRLLEKVDQMLQEENKIPNYSILYMEILNTINYASKSPLLNEFLSGLNEFIEMIVALSFKSPKHQKVSVEEIGEIYYGWGNFETIFRHAFIWRNFEIIFARADK